MGWPWFVRAIYPAFSKWYMRPRTEADSQARANAIATTRSPVGRKAVSQMWHSFNLPAHDLRGDAGQITAPTMVVWGRRDPILPGRPFRRPVQLGDVPGSDPVRGCGHELGLDGGGLVAWARRSRVSPAARSSR